MAELASKDPASYEPVPWVIVTVFAFQFPELTCLIRL